MSGAPRWRAFRSAQRLHAFLRVLPAPLDAARFGLAAGAAAILRLRFATPARAGAAAGRFGAFFARAAGFDLAAPRGRCAGRGSGSGLGDAARFRPPRGGGGGGESSST